METRLKEVLAVVNQKGGVAKTTTVQSMALAMKRYRKNWRVLVLDLDPQGDLSKLMGWNDSRKGQPTMTEALTDVNGRLPIYKSDRGVYFVPATETLQDIEPEIMKQLDSGVHPYQVLLTRIFDNVEDCTGEGIEHIYDYFDYVLMDCPPDLSIRTLNAMAAASGLLIPVQMEGLAVSGIGNIIVKMGTFQKGLNKKLQLRGLLPVMVDERLNLTDGLVNYLRKTYGDYVCKTMIRRCIKMGEAQTRKKDIYSYKPYSAVGIDYENLVKELFG